MSGSDRLGKLIKLIFILLIIGVIAIAVTPLKLYYNHIQPHIKPVQLNGISGSAVKGSADSLSYMSAPLGNAEWLLYPNSYNGVGGKVRVYKEHYDLTFGLGKLTADRQSFDSIKGYLDWQLIKPFLQMRYGQMAGFAGVNLNHVEYDKTGGFNRIEGQITLQDFKMTQPSQIDLGTVTVTFDTQGPGMVVGNFASQSNVLNVSGSLVLQPHRWQLNLDIIPKAGHFEVDAVFNSVGNARRGG
ncbi:MAG: type II secretion system protein N, partial [Marinicella sp.]